MKKVKPLLFRLVPVVPGFPGCCQAQAPDALSGAATGTAASCGKHMLLALTTGLLALVLLLNVSGCATGPLSSEDPAGAPEQLPENQGPDNGKDAEKMEEEKTGLQNNLPPLDRDVPENLKTATLAMG